MCEDDILEAWVSWKQIEETYGEKEAKELYDEGLIAEKLYPGSKSVLGLDCIYL